MKIGICDDIPEERQQIANYCQNLGYTDIFLYDSGEELLNSPECSSLTLLFLDIEMDGMSGIEVKKILEQSNPYTYIVFNTTHQEMMPEAFGCNVISFISKPFSELSIQHSIEKAVFLSRDFFPVRIDEKKTLSCKDILYLHTEQKYTIFYTLNGESFSARKPLKEWVIELDDLGFSPISRSAMINLKYYVDIRGKNVVLRQDVRITISRRYVNLLKEKFQNYMLLMMRHA